MVNNNNNKSINSTSGGDECSGVPPTNYLYRPNLKLRCVFISKCTNGTVHSAYWMVCTN